MSITERLNKIKPWVWPINLILVGTLAFGLGRLSKIEETKTPVMIEGGAMPMVSSATSSMPNLKTPKSSGILVGSKNGTKYYYPACPGVARIKEENKIWFASVDQAKGAGYTPAANCPGL